MNASLSLNDFIALSPLLILLFGALILLLVESFGNKSTKNFSMPIVLATLALALVRVFVANVDAVQNSLLTPWLTFDFIGKFFSVLFLCIGLGVVFISTSFFRNFDASQGEYYFFLLSALFGLILIGQAADFLTLFLGLETLSIALYILCGYMKQWTFSKEGALKYFLIGAIGTAFFVYGVALIYGALGTTSLRELLKNYETIDTSSAKTLFFGGIAMVTVGLAFKAALVPFHTWAPDAYDASSNPITAFMAVGTKIGAFAALFRIFINSHSHFSPLWTQAIAWLAIVTMIYANFVALKQTDVRRFFAYSGISHAGFLLLPFLGPNREAMQALGFYFVVYALATLGCFAVLSYIDHDPRGAKLADLKGFYYRAPFPAFVLIICLLTLAGIPPTAGFFAKFYVLKIAFQAGYYSVVLIGLLMTILSIYYYIRIISLLFIKSIHQEKETYPNLSLRIVELAALMGLVIFSCFPDLLTTLLG